MFVKICGTTSLADAEMALAEGADALGFIFAPSKRRVSVEQVREITSQLPRGVRLVGVFTEPGAEAIAHTVREAGLTAVQLHMAQDAALLEHLHAEFGTALELWQVVPFEIAPADPASPDNDNVEGDAAEHAFRRAFLQALSEEHISVVLVDAAKAGASGGLGVSFPWKRAAAFIEDTMLQAVQSGKRDLPKVIVAGGLRPENVAEAVRALRPWGVDCVSGVEAEPGRKDRNRLTAFLAAARDGR